MRMVETANRFFAGQADKKAQMLIQVNGLMTSVLIALTVYIAPVHRVLLVPVAIQLTGSLIVISICLMVTRPRYFAGSVDSHIKRMEKAGKEPNLEDPSLYWDLLCDSHLQAGVLAIKYKYLQLSYVVFMAALLLSSAATVVVVAVVRGYL